MSAFQEMTLARFAETLASSEPTPGGGSASALAGALAACLVAMVARLTTGALDEVEEEADRLRHELLALVDEDAAAFDRVMAAFRLPNGTAAEQATRSEAIQAGYQTAVGPPSDVCARALRILELALRVAERGNPNAVSDAGVGAELASAALEGAAFNVRINLTSIKDDAYRTRHDDQLASVQARGRALREQALATVRAKLA
ncbi:MAG: cyclodeaminase/cyclohydrolase family protein [Verrucomicrobiota bacterium]